MNKPVTMLLICMSLILAYCCSNIQDSKSAITGKGTSLEDSLRKELDMKDSIKVLKVQYYTSGTHAEHVYEFIDYNRNSKFHQELLKFRSYAEPENEEEYIQVYKNLSDSIKSQAKTIQDRRLLNNWLPIYKYRGEFYFYMDCDFQGGFKITDSVLINYDMDGPYPWIIVGSRKEGNTTFIEAVDVQRRHTSVTMELVDSTHSIYKSEENNWCAYYIPVEHIHDFPIIVQHCHEEADNLLDFDNGACK